MLGHDTHGHAEDDGDRLLRARCRPSPRTSRTAATSSACVSASYTDLGRPGRRPGADHGGPGQRPAEAAGGRVRVDQSGHEHRADGRRRRRPATRRPRQRRLDRAQRAYQPAQHRLAHVPGRRTAAGGPAGLAAGAVEVRSGAFDGPILPTAKLTSTGGTATWQSQTFPITDPGGAHRLYLRVRPVTGGPGGNNFFNLNWVEFNGEGVTVVRTNQPGDVSGTVPATLSLALGPPASFGAFTPGVAADLRDVDGRQRDLDRRRGDAVGRRSRARTPRAPRRTARSRCRSRSWCRRQRAGGGAFAPVGGSSTPTTLLTLRRAGVQRRGDDRLPAGDRRERGPADGDATRRPSRSRCRRRRRELVRLPAPP